MQEALFSQALGLAEPWAVDSVKLDVARSRIDLHLAWRAKSGTCPACGAAEQKVHDQRQRSWRHLDFFQYEAHVHCELPRIGCLVCHATTQLPVWSYPVSTDSSEVLCFGLIVRQKRRLIHGACLWTRRRALT